MNTQLKPTEDQRDFHYGTSVQEFVTMRVGGQLFGISVMMVQDVLRNQSIAHIPLAPSIVAGSLNLRGRIVTVIDLRSRLGMEKVKDISKEMHVVFEYNQELYSLMVDSVGEVLTLSLDQFERGPVNMEESWREVSVGIFKLQNELLVILDTQSLLGKKMDE